MIYNLCFCKGVWVDFIDVGVFGFLLNNLIFIDMMDFFI